MTLRLGRGSFADTDLLVMAIVNRTPDSFYDRGATFADEAAMARVDEAVAHGADLVDIGGVKAAPGGSCEVSPVAPPEAGLGVVEEGALACSLAASALG